MCDSNVSLSLALVSRFQNTAGIPNPEEKPFIWHFEMLRASLGLVEFQLKTLFWLMGMQGEIEERSEAI